MQANSTWQLFKSCILTEGFSRAIIQDVQRGKYYTIPLTLVSFIKELSSTSLMSILSNLDHAEREIVEEYMLFLVGNELIFDCPNDLIDNFLPISTEYDFPAHISNAVIEIDDTSISYLLMIFDQLAKLLCFNLILIIKCKLNRTQFDEILKSFDKLEPEDVGLVLNNNLEIDFSALKSQYNFLTSITFHTYIVKPDSRYDPNLALNITYTDKDFTNHKYCGIVDSSYFTLGLPHYTESLHHNTCLNRKIAIDAEGNIKNCTSMKESFGNIKDTTLEEAINKPGFKKYWNIKKDEITKCKDCEFRHVCTDCRAYLDNPDDCYSAPLKCGYNPYICEWEEWSTMIIESKRNGL